MRILSLLFIAALISGCLVRTYTVEKPRVDREVTGNRGYLSGSPSAEAPEVKETRKVTVFEVEMGSHRPQRAAKKEEAAPAEDIEDEMTASYMEEEAALDEEVFPLEEESSEPEYEMYTVQKNDTLQKISAKFYGTSKKYLKLYEFNTDVMKSPDKIYPGMELKIPALK